MLTTEDAKKIAGAYLSEGQRADNRLKEYRFATVRALIAQRRIDTVRDLPDDEAAQFVRDLLDVWDMPKEPK